MVVNGCISQSPHNAGLDRSGIIVGVWQPLLMVSYHWRSPESWLAEAKGGGRAGAPGHRTVRASAKRLRKDAGEKPEAWPRAARNNTSNNSTIACGALRVGQSVEKERVLGQRGRAESWGVWSDEQWRVLRTESTAESTGLGGVWSDVGDNGQ